MLSFYCVLLLLVGVATYQHHATTTTAAQFRTSGTHHQPGFDGAIRYAQSRTPMSTRYDTYRPLDTYRRRYGTYANRTRNHGVYITSVSRGNSLGGSETSSIHVNNNRREEEGHRSHLNWSERGRQEVIRGRGSHGVNFAPTMVSTIIPPLIESSTGFTHYGILDGRGRGRGRGQIRRPSTNPAARSGGGRPGERVSGEGYGEAYLKWSEFGKGCSCDECGTRNCQHFTGICECFENVVGDQCDRCAPDHWGFASCQGCQPCQCGLASIGSQCDEGTGQCQCEPGVTGQRCDQCNPSYWNYTQDGCQECSCREGFSVGVGCDPQTGQCQCLPGVVGANCDHCPYRWVLIDDYGCQECDDCVHALLDTTDELASLITPTIDEFKTAAHSFFLHQRLGVINSTVAELRPQVNLMDFSEAETLSLDAPLEALLKDAQIMLSQTEIVKDHADEAAEEGLRVHVEALKVQEDVEAAFDQARRITLEINRLVIGLETGTGAQLEQAIREAEAVVAEMELRDFNPNRDKAEVELELAKEVLENLQGFYLPIKTHQNATKDHENHLKEFAAKIKEMRGYIDKAEKQTHDAQQLIRNNELFGYQSLTKKLDKIRLLSTQIEDSLLESRDMVDQAQENYMNSSANIEMLGMEIEQLRAAKSTLNDTVATTLVELEEAKGPAQNAQDHAENLRIRAANLDSQLADTREVAESALTAANAYKFIVLAIDDAYNASLSANMSAAKAVEMSEGVSVRAEESQGTSEEKHQLAELRVQQVERDLQPQLEFAKQNVHTLRDMNSYIRNTLAFIDRGLTDLDQEVFSEEAERLKDNAVTSQMEADEAISKVTNVEDRLVTSAADARLLVRNVADGNRDINRAREQVLKVEQDIPRIVEKASLLHEEKDQLQARTIDLRERLDKLRRTIQNTRELTNKIKVGVSFQPTTTLELKNPKDLTKASTSTKVSLFTRTEEPSGLLLFLGTPTGGSQQMRHTTSDDFLALELDGGYVRLTMNLGAGPHSVEYNRLFVADGEWTKITVERIGKVVRLLVERENMNTEPIEKVLPGRYSVFNLHPTVSKIYVAGIPAGVEVDSSVRSTSFIGDMEDLRINDQPLGLWNFMQDGTNDNVNRGAMERDRLVNLVPTTGLRFSGEGYAAMNTSGYRFRIQFSFQLDFKTYAEDGILYMITGSQNQYMTLAMEEGHLIFQYNLGSGVATMRSESTYHNGEWHHAEVTRQELRGVLKIGSETVSGSSGGARKVLDAVSDTMYFGGYPGEHNFQYVTNEDFHGCIDNVVVSSFSVDLSQSKETQGTVPGCPIQVANLVSYDPSSPGFIKFGSPEGNGLQLVFKFKTDQSDGLILYASTRSQNSYLSLSLADSALVLRAAPGGELTTGSYDKYNDSEWHVVIASREDNELRLDIDDFKSYKVRVAEQAIPFDGPVFFGGVPDTIKSSAADSATDTNFFGCIGDATLNGHIVNFAQSEEKVGAHLQKCPLSKTTSIIYERDRATNTSGYPDQPIIVELPETEHESDYPATSLPFDPSPTTTTTSTITPITTTTTTTTTITTTTESYLETTERMLPLDSCALPVEPAAEDIDPSRGFRFGSKRSSRIEFETLPDGARGDFTFSFEFKTLANDSIIFYSSNPEHRDYVTFYIKDGKIVFSFEPGTGKALMRTDQSFNDGVWHSVTLERQDNTGLLAVDGFHQANDTASGNSVYIDHQAPYYYGGIDPEKAEMVLANTEQTELSFSGCLRNLRLNYKRVGGQHQAYGIAQCSENVEPGVYFGTGTRAHGILRKRFSVGRVFEMTMEIKPRMNTGVIVSVHGRRDFVLLQLNNGTLELKVDNGKGIMTVIYKPPSPWTFCDGQWHSIKLIKNKNIAILDVDDITTNPATGKIGATSTDTRNPLFLGSQPFVTRRRGGAVSDKFVGCVRHVTVNKDVIDLAYATFVGNVNGGSCPTI